ncbi:MAG TPA: lipid A deacylase LpxR family protein [Opitutaceae bacterium]
MSTRQSRSLILLFIAALPVAAQESNPVADQRARDSGVFTLYFENDFFGGQDRHYTNGFKLSWLSRDLTSWGQEGWRRRFIDTLPFVNRPGGQKNFGFAFGQNIYVPQDISRVPPDPTDRPYAGWSYLELTFVSKTESVMDTLSFQAGMVGRHSYAQDMQIVIHEWLNDEHPDGWDYQLKDEVGVNIVFERKWRLYGRTMGNALGFDFVPHAGASLGNVQTYANAGATLRLGLNLPSDFGISLIRGASLPNAPLDDRDPRVAARRSASFFVFAGVDGRAVARDIFLDGNTWRDSPSVDKESFVGDAFYGVGIFFGRRWQLTYTEVVRSREFEGQDEENYFGSITLSRTF